MTSDVKELQDKISRLKRTESVSRTSLGTKGYGVAIVILTDLFSCIFVGLGLGLFLQKVLHTSVLLTAGLTLLGGIAGLYTVIRFALEQDKK